MKNKYLKVLLTSSMLCSSLFGSNSLNAMKQSYSPDNRYRERIIIEKRDIKIYTSYMPENEFAPLYDSMNWQLYTNRLREEYSRNYNDNLKRDLFFLITYGDSPVAIGITRPGSYRYTYIHLEPMDGFSNKDIERLMKEYYPVISRYLPAQKQKPMSVSKNEDFSVQEQHMSQKQASSLIVETSDNFQFQGKNSYYVYDKRSSRILDSHNNFISPLTPTNYDLININKSNRGLKTNSYGRSINNINISARKSHNPMNFNSYSLPTNEFHSANEGKRVSYNSNSNDLTQNSQEYRQKSNDTSSELYEEDKPKKPISPTKVPIKITYPKQGLEDDDEYQKLFNEQSKVLIEVEDSEALGKIKNGISSSAHDLVYIDPRLIKVPTGYNNDKNPEKCHQLYANDENNPARIYNERLADFSRKTNIYFDNLCSATEIDKMKMLTSDYIRVQNGKLPLHFNLRTGKINKLC